jgi:hypothetical protein
MTWISTCLVSVQQQRHKTPTRLSVHARSSKPRALLGALRVLVVGWRTYRRRGEVTDTPSYHRKFKTRTLRVPLAAEKHPISGFRV